MVLACSVGHATGDDALSDRGLLRSGTREREPLAPPQVCPGPPAHVPRSVPTSFSLNMCSCARAVSRAARSRRSGGASLRQCSASTRPPTGRRRRLLRRAPLVALQLLRQAALLAAAVSARGRRGPSSRPLKSRSTSASTPTPAPVCPFFGPSKPPRRPFPVRVVALSLHSQRFFNSPTCARACTCLLLDCTRRELIAKRMQYV